MLVHLKRLNAQTVYPIEGEKKKKKKKMGQLIHWRDQAPFQRMFWGASPPYP